MPIWITVRYKALSNAIGAVLSILACIRGRHCYWMVQYFSTRDLGTWRISDDSKRESGCYLQAVSSESVYIEDLIHIARTTGPEASLADSAGVRSDERCNGEGNYDIRSRC